MAKYQLTKTGAQVQAILDAVGVLQSNVGTIADLTTEDKTSVVNAINELASSISGISADMGDWDELADTNADGTGVSLNSGCKFSDYRYIVFLLKYNGEVFAQYFIPLSLFQEARYWRLSGFSMTSTSTVNKYVQASVRYESDTTLTITNRINSPYVRILGVK